MNFALVTPHVLHFWGDFELGMEPRKSRQFLRGSLWDCSGGGPGPRSLIGILLGEHLWMVEANPPLHFALLLGGAIHISAQLPASRPHESGRQVVKRPLRLERMLVSQTCDVIPSWW